MSLSTTIDAVKQQDEPESPEKMRPRTFLERQPYILVYGAIISLFSPAATAYQLCCLYHIRPVMSELLRMSFVIFPHQTALKALQMIASTPVKEYLNPWAAFAVVGVLQGGVYGQANVYFSKAMELGKVATMKGIFRGSVFAGLRDTVSQGIPFMCSKNFQNAVIDPIWATPADDADAAKTKHFVSVIITSVMATYMSQGLHNCQIAMQADQSLGYIRAVRSVFHLHGFKFLIKGAEARVGLLLLVNVLNDVLLKPAWSPVKEK